MVADCLFCKIVAKEIDSDIVYETDEVVAFKDINPGAPTHILFVPRRHIASAQELTASDGGLLGALFEAIAKVASNDDLAGGHRIVTNVGPDAGQSVHHLHFHLLGGRRMAWPPG
jgi:histidine triad (HIT) family protein